MNIYHGLPKIVSGEIEKNIELFYKKPSDETLTKICQEIIDAYEIYHIEEEHKKFWWSYYSLCQCYLNECKFER